MIPSPLKDKVPPHNDDAEKATLGALLLDPESISIILQYLRADDFYRNAHKKIFQSIVDLFNKGEELDLITLTEELRRKGELEECGVQVMLLLLLLQFLQVQMSNTMQSLLRIQV